MRLALPILLVAAVGAVLFLLFREDSELERREAIQREQEEAQVPPHLRGIPARLREERERERREREAAREKEEAARRAEAETSPLVLRGRVLVDETGAPIPAAWLRIVAHAEPCPRLGGETELAIRELFPYQTGEDGEFALPLAADAAPVDLIVFARGRVPAMLCAPRLDEEHVIRMQKGLALKGRAVREDGRPIEGVGVEARPAPETPQVPGHASLGGIRTPEDGTYEIDGLLPGGILVDADHPHFMPATWGPIDPAAQSTLDLVLQPALIATFRIRTDDGREVENPTLVWEAPRGVRGPQAVLLGRMADDPFAPGESLGEEGLHGPVRLPANEGPLVLRVRADGYATWTAPAFRPRPEGGEETFDVLLRGDLTTGSARIALEDERGDPINAAEASIRVELAALDPDAAAAAFVVQPAEDLSITALPAGRYRLRLLSARFAPLETEIVVTAGQETVTTLRARPPANLRVRFHGPRRVLVRFRLLQEGREVVAFPADGTTTIDGALAAGDEGLLLTGLGGGSYQIEVTSDEVRAPTTSVRLATGDTEEVDIAVSDR